MNDEVFTTLKSVMRWYKQQYDCDITELFLLESIKVWYQITKSSMTAKNN